MVSGSLCLSSSSPPRLLGRMKDRLSQQTREARVTASKGTPKRSSCRLDGCSDPPLEMSPGDEPGSDLQRAVEHL